MKELRYIGYDYKFLQKLRFSGLILVLIQIPPNITLLYSSSHKYLDLVSNILRIISHDIMLVLLAILIWHTMDVCKIIFNTVNEINKKQQRLTQITQENGVSTSMNSPNSRYHKNSTMSKNTGKMKNKFEIKKSHGSDQSLHYSQKQNNYSHDCDNNHNHNHNRTPQFVLTCQQAIIDENVLVDSLLGSSMPSHQLSNHTNKLNSSVSNKIDMKHNKDIDVDSVSTSNIFYTNMNNKHQNNKRNDRIQSEASRSIMHNTQNGDFVNHSMMSFDSTNDNVRSMTHTIESTMTITVTNKIVKWRYRNVFLLNAVSIALLINTGLDISLEFAVISNVIWRLTVAGMACASSFFILILLNCHLYSLHKYGKSLLENGEKNNNKRSKEATTIKSIEMTIRLLTIMTFFFVIYWACYGFRESSLKTEPHYSGSYVIIVDGETHSFLSDNFWDDFYTFYEISAFLPSAMFHIVLLHFTRVRIPDHYTDQSKNDNHNKNNNNHKNDNNDNNNNKNINVNFKKESPWPHKYSDQKIANANGDKYDQHVKAFINEHQFNYGFQRDVVRADIYGNVVDFNQSPNPH